MANNDPFQGLRLSEQAPVTGKVEQRLFTSEPPKPAPEPEPAAKQKREQRAAVPNEDNASLALAARTEGRASPPAPKAPAKAVERFDLNEEPLYKASYLFTQDELERLEDLKLELRRDLDTKVTKNDLIRSALHMLLEDHDINGSRSYATRKMLKR